MIEALASFQDITTILVTFTGIIIISLLAMDELMKRVDEFFSSYSEDEEAERRIAMIATLFGLGLLLIGLALLIGFIYVGATVLVWLIPIGLIVLGVSMLVALIRGIIL